MLGRKARIWRNNIFPASDKSQSKNQGDSPRRLPRRRPAPGVRITAEKGRPGPWLKRRLSARVSVGFAIGFGLGFLGMLVLAAAALFGLAQAYDGKILPGVHAGAVDLSGLTRDEAISALDSAYASLGQGQIVITTPGGGGTITYQEAGRGPDSAAIADAALAVGRTDNPLTSLAASLRTVAAGSGVPVTVKVDPTALAYRLDAITRASLVPASDASVNIVGVGHSLQPAATGRGVDENAIATEALDRLSSADAPAEIDIDGRFTTISPRVSDADAQAAAAGASRMFTAVTLTYGATTWTIDASTIHSWITFGIRENGTYGPTIDPAQIKAFVATLAKDIDTDPVEPTVIYKAGVPSGLSPSQAGTALNLDATAQAVEAYVDGLASGDSAGAPIVAVVVNAVQPTFANPGLAGLVRIGQWATSYFPGESNGYGANIEVPAKVLNGMVIGPGQGFSFLDAVGPIDEAHGFKMGGAILDGKSVPTGAIGGGICSASTTFFNAAARAGLQIDERHAHYYYINRYPVGLDATVFSNGTSRLDMRWTNDTAYPIVIRSWWSGRSSRVLYVELWSLPTGRTTTFAGGVKKNLVKAADGTQYVPSLPAGQKTYRQEYPADGYDTTVTRTVVNAAGDTIHRDTWTSHYYKVDGLLQIAGTPPPSATPISSSSPSSTTPPTPRPAPTPTPALPTPSPTPSTPPAPSPAPSIPPSSSAPNLSSPMVRRRLGRR